MICTPWSSNNSRGIDLPLNSNWSIHSSLDMTKPTKWVCAQRRQISLGICPVWSVFAVCMKKASVLSYPLSALRRLWSDLADAQADLSLRRVHSHFVGFVMSWLISNKNAAYFAFTSTCLKATASEVILSWSFTTAQSTLFQSCLDFTKHRAISCAITSQASDEWAEQHLRGFVWAFTSSSHNLLFIWTLTPKLLN